MSLVAITINNKKFQLSCDDGKEQELITIASNLDNFISTIKNSSKHASTELLLLMAALSLQNQISTSTKKDLNNDNPTDDRSSEIINNMIKYLEELDHKFNKC